MAMDIIRPIPPEAASPADTSVSSQRRRQQQQQRHKPDSLTSSMCMRHQRCHHLLHVFPVIFLLLASLPQSIWSADEVPTPIGKCDNGRMSVTLPQYALPFTGIIHVRGFRSNPACFANSTRDSFAPPSLSINLLASPTDPDYCGVISLKEGREKAISVAIRAHSSLELQEDKYFLLTCGNLKTATRGSRQSKSLREREQDGLTFYDLESGHTKNSVAILGKSYYFGPKEEGHLIGSCTAFGSRTADPSSVVELLDNKACPSDAAIINSVEFMNDEDGKSRKMKVKIKSMFRFPNQDFREPEKSKDSKVNANNDDDDKWSDNRVTVQCTAVPCGGKCPAPCTKEAGQLLQSSSTSLVTTSVNVLNPGMECDHELNHQLTRDWLMALLFCLGILLLVMFCLNLFLCSAMACTCTKQEIVDTSSVDEVDTGVPAAYDYDPYKTSDHPLYASLQRKGAQSMIEPGARHQYNPNYEITRESYSHVPNDRMRSSSRHSNFY